MKKNLYNKWWMCLFCRYKACNWIFCFSNCFGQGETKRFRKIVETLWWHLKCSYVLFNTCLYRIWMCLLHTFPIWFSVRFFPFILNFMIYKWSSNETNLINLSFNFQKNVERKKEFNEYLIFRTLCVCENLWPNRSKQKNFNCIV